MCGWIISGAFPSTIPSPLERAGNGAAGGPGPGLALFDAAREELGPLPILAEDLGLLDAGVYRLLAQTASPGWMCTSLRGRHCCLWIRDDQRAGCSMPPPTTARPWRAGVPQRGEDPDRVIRELYASPAGWTMFQLQDLLGLGDEARFNTPGTVEARNWSWQAMPDQLTDQVAERFRRLAEENGR